MHFLIINFYYKLLLIKLLVLFLLLILNLCHLF